MKKALEKRFKFLYTGESTALLLFIPLSLYIHNQYPNLQLYKASITGMQSGSV